MIMNKKQKLEGLRKEIEKCKECKRFKKGKLVFGEGNVNSKIMFLGEAPGKEEAKTGRPFVGRSGKFLTKMLKSIGIDRKNVYITSPVKYYPGKRAPNKKEIQAGLKHTLKQIEIIKPKIIVLLGNVALKFILDKNLTISKVHGKIIKRKGITYIPTFHPSAAMRFPKIKIKMIKDFKKLKRLKV